MPKIRAPKSILYKILNTLFFIRTSLFGAGAERFYIFLRREAENVLKVFLNSVISWWKGKSLHSVRKVGLLVRLSTTTQS